MSKDDELTKRAKAEAAHYGEDWEQMGQVRRNIYLHNAGCPIDQLPEAKEVPASPTQCPACDGTGLIEHEAGLLQTECEECGGSGIIAVGEEKSKEEEKPAPIHKHYYRKDGVCACGAKLSPAGMKRRELKARKGK